jgi:hypothetical protein
MDEDCAADRAMSDVSDAFIKSTVEQLLEINSLALAM